MPARGFAGSLNSCCLNRSPEDSQLPEVSGRSCPELISHCSAVLWVKTFRAPDEEGRLEQCPPVCLQADQTDCRGWGNKWWPLQLSQSKQTLESTVNIKKGYLKVICLLEKKAKSSCL